MQLVGQGGPSWVLVQVERVRTVAASAEGALSVTVAPEEALAGAMMSRNSAVGSTSGGASGKEVYRHRGGNRQLELDNGQRWHLPRGVSVSDVPTSDPLGDQLQAAAREVAARWSKDGYGPKVTAAIQRMLKRGLVHRAELLERQARGRWVEAQLQLRCPQLTWNRRGVDVTGPSAQKYHYEILSGTESNFELHGQRMASTFFRMIFF